LAHSKLIWLLVSLLALTGCSSLRTPKPLLPPPPGPVAAPVPAPILPIAPVTPPPMPPVGPPQVLLDPARVNQGDMVTLRLDRAVPGPVRVQIERLSAQPQTYLFEGRAAALIGFPATATPGIYPVTVSWDGGQWRGEIEVIRKAFTEDRLLVTEEQQAIYYDPRQEVEWRKLFTVRSQSHPVPLWSGPFLVPLEGDLRVTTYFGEIRFVNGVETGRHSGIDFGTPTGTPILAPAHGVIVMAELLIVTGWSIVIDHGMNLFTVYYHLDTITVKEGQSIRPGQLIGTVGSTGFSTGPHLHWTASIGNTPIDPWPLTLRPVLGIPKLVESQPDRPR